MLGRLSFTILAAVFWSAQAFAATGSVPQFNPKGVAGHVGAGFTYTTVNLPSTRFKMDPGIFANLGGEKGFGFLNLSLTFSLGYLSSEGQADYHYRTLSGADYTATDAKFKYDLFNIGLGLKFRIIDGFFFRPYVEGGGTFGYSTLKFNFNSAQRAANTLVGPDAKDGESLFAFGKYAEGGADVAFSPSFGLLLAARIEWVDTKEFEILYDTNNEKQKLLYTTMTYYVGLLKSF
ncbi:MAG: hypothetical protein ABL958_17935 [Bdellovibrionia bacterium]